MVSPDKSENLPEHDHFILSGRLLQIIVGLEKSFPMSEFVKGITKNDTKWRKL